MIVIKIHHKTFRSKFVPFLKKVCEYFCDEHILSKKETNKWLDTQIAMMEASEFKTREGLDQTDDIYRGKFVEVFKRLRDADFRRHEHKLREDVPLELKEFTGGYYAEEINLDLKMSGFMGELGGKIIKVDAAVMRDMVEIFDGNFTQHMRFEEWMPELNIKDRKMSRVWDEVSQEFQKREDNPFEAVIREMIKPENKDR